MWKPHPEWSFRCVLKSKTLWAFGYYKTYKRSNTILFVAVGPYRFVFQQLTTKSMRIQYDRVNGHVEKDEHNPLSRPHPNHRESA